jgi:uncharacterized protein
MPQPELILFAKQPVPGEVKTRLQPVYTPAQAAEIAACLVRATVELAVSSWPGDIYLYGAPDADHPLFHSLAEEFDIKLAGQSAGDLGTKMMSALRDGIERHGAAAILGCDVPQCEWDILDYANGRLARGRNVIGPTNDGGYYFIGLQESRPELFRDIEWGGCRVLAETLRSAEELGLEFDFLKILSDVDTPSKLWCAAQKVEALRRFIEP